MKKLIIIAILTTISYAKPMLFIKLKELKHNEFIPMYKTPKVTSPILFKLNSNSYLQYKNIFKQDKSNNLKWIKVKKNNKSGWILETFIVKNKNNKIKENKIRPKSIESTAKSKLNAPYKYATAGPNTFDCSGFTYWVYQKNGINIPRTSLEQSKVGKSIKKDNLQVGDLLFFDTSNKGHVNHTGIYLGDNKFIHASSGKAFSVVISTLNKGFYKSKFLFAKRVSD